MLPLRYAMAWLIGGWLLVAFAVAGSLLPGQTLPVAILQDKLLHFGVYLLMTFWFTGIYRRARYLHIAIGLLALGLLLEWLQAEMVPRRSGSYADLLANFGGVAGGLVLAVAGFGGWCVRFEEWLVKAPPKSGDGA